MNEHLSFFSFSTKLISEHYLKENSASLVPQIIVNGQKMAQSTNAA